MSPLKSLKERPAAPIAGAIAAFALIVISILWPGSRMALVVGAIGSNIVGVFTGMLVESSQDTRERKRRVSVFHSRLSAMILEVARACNTHAHSHPIQIMTQGLPPIDEINQVREEAIALEMPRELLDALADLRRAAKEAEAHINKGEAWLHNYTANFRAVTNDLERAKAAVAEAAKRPEAQV